MTTKIWEASFEGIIETFCVHVEGNILLDTREHGINIKKKNEGKKILLLEKELLYVKKVYSQALKWIMQLEINRYAMLLHEV